jgi:CBS domain containing-hemolysin-like protein
MDPWQIVFIVVLLIITGWFSGCETAISSCNQFKLRVKANDGHKTAKYAIKFIDKFDKSVISVLIGYNIASTIMSTLATIMFAVFLPSELVNLVSTVTIAVLCYVFSDTLPKIIARAAPDTYVRVSVYPMIFFYYLFWPLTQFFYLISKLVKKVFKVKEDVTFTEEDFSNTVESFEETGVLEEDESDVIQNALDFDDITVKECFTPLDKMTCICIDGLTNVQLNKLLLDSKFSRIPIYSENIDNIIGILNVKQYFNEYMEDKHVSVPSILSEPYFISPNTMIDDLFEGFKKHRTHLAIVKQNEKVLGMITMDDVLEELVGEMTSTKLVEEDK